MLTPKWALQRYDMTVARIQALLDPWLPGLLARLVFLAVLSFYFFTSFLTKVGPGIAGFFQIQPGAFYQIAPFAVDAAGGDVEAISLFPWGLVVLFGTYSEFLLPILLVIGLFTRIAAIGMIGFILVQSLVDITVHKVGPETIGALFDRFPDSVILDQRLLWLFPLVYLAIKGGGVLSVDTLLVRMRRTG